MDQNEISLATYDSTERMTFANLNSPALCAVAPDKGFANLNSPELCAVAPDKGFANLNSKDSVRVKNNLKKSIK